MSGGGWGIGFFELLIGGVVAMGLIGGLIAVVVLFASGGRKNRH